MSYVSCNRSFYTKGKGKGSPYSITERRVAELIPVLDSALWYHTTCSATTSGAQKWRFWGKMKVEALDFGFATPKKHFLARNHVV